MKVKIKFLNKIAAIVCILLLPGILSAQESDETWPPPAPGLDPGMLTETEINLIDLALESINMTWDDMGFRKDYIADDFRLGVAQRALDDPYSLVLWNYEWDGFLLNPKTPSEILYRAAVDLDATFYNRNELIPTMTSVGRPQNFSLLPDSWEAPVARLDQAVYLASTRMQNVVLASLSEEDRSFLPTYLLCHFLDEEYEECPVADDYSPPEEFLDAIRNFDLDALMGTVRELSLETDTAIDAMLSNMSGLGLTQQFSMQGLSGDILIGSTGDDIWYMDEWPTASIIIDPGGNDVYYGQVAVAGNLRDEQNNLAALAIDLGGNDSYYSGGERSCGSGVFGIAGLIDVSGDDIYRSGDFSQACGLFGAGILVDRGGTDIYNAGLLVQGAGAIGAGLLIDSTGNDQYHAALYAQGMAYTRGWGMLSDRDGCDTYYAGGVYDDFGRWPESTVSLSQGFSIGMRPKASGGVGILHDRNGNDFFNTEVYGQGVSYWYSVGALIDDNGNDWYQSQQYAQGSGIHLSSGILLDRGKGYDRYSCHACTQGFGHDLAVGWLIDEGGNDYYTADSLAQGSGNANGVGLLIDRSGRDGYFGRNPVACGGHGNLARDYGSIGILIDMGGSDTYTDEISSDGSWWTKTNWGAGIDVGDDWWNVVLDDDGNEIERTLLIPGMGSGESASDINGQ